MFIKLLNFNILTIAFILCGNTIRALPCDQASPNLKLIFPYDFNDFNIRRDNASALCAKNGASLVEIQSYEKQALVESFLVNKSGTLTNSEIYWWIGGQRDTTDTTKFKWSKSGNQFNYTNWANNEPNSYYGYTNAYIAVTKGETLGKWTVATSGSTTAKVFCECNSVSA